MGLFKNGKCVSDANLTGKVAVVTGANSGIGFETARDFARRGAKVIMANRNMELSENAAKKIKDEFPQAYIRIVKLNLASLKSVKECGEELLRSEPQIDLLINNAGVICPYQETEDGLEMQFQTNHLAPFLFTLLLLPRLTASAPARIVNVSSIAHLMGKVNYDDLQSKKSYSMNRAYAQTKLCNVLFTLELTDRLKGTGVVAYAVHPGVVATEMGRHLGKGTQRCTSFMAKLIKTPLQGAQTTLHCALDDKLANQHKKIYYSDCAPGKISRKARNKSNAERLWKVSEELVKEHLN